MHPPKYPRTPYLPFSPSIDESDRDNVIDPAVFVNRRVIITEKLDGSNVAMLNGALYARSTTTPSEHPWHAMVKKHHAWKTQNLDVVFYGEDIYGVHSIEYEPVRETDTFHLFAVRKDSKFLSWQEVRTSALSLDFPLVPVLYEGFIGSVEDLETRVTTFQRQKSALGGKREGVVVRVSDQFDEADWAISIAKSVRANHVQTNQHWTRRWKPAKIIGRRT